MLKNKTRLLLLGTALVSPPGAALAQTTFLLPSPDLPLSAPTSLVLNGGAAIPAINRITGFGQVFGFGSSSTDTRSSVPVLPGYGTRFSNSNSVTVELFAPLVGATNRPGSLVPLASPPPTNFAAAGTTSLTTLPQVAQFQNVYGSFAPNDIAFQWTGINDFSGGGVTAGTVGSIAASDVANQTKLASQLIGLGARNLVVVGLPDFGNFSFFTRPLAGNTSSADALNAGSQLVNAGLRPNLAALHWQTGANIHFFDQNLLVNQIRANPTLYGFSVQGVQPGVQCVSLLGTTQASCPAGASFAVQNQFLSWDGIHYTYRFHDIQSLAIANQLLAPYTIAPQAELGRSVAWGFAQSLFNRLDAYRLQNSPVLIGQGQSADVPGRKLPPATVQVATGGVFSLFAMGNFAGGDQKDRLGSTGYDYRSAAFTVGAEYVASPGFLFGAAFNYANPTANLNQWFGGKINLESYQFAGFASFSRPNVFLDAVVTYGVNRYRIDRPGVVIPLSASPKGDAVTAAAKGGYLFDLGTLQAGPLDFGTIRLGPIAGLSYARTTVNAYAEAGDPLLTQGVNRQSVEGLTGSAGLQLRYALSFLGNILGVQTSSFVNVTAEHDFRDGLRTISTFQTYAPELVINTPAGRRNETYGKVSSGTSFDFTPNLSAMVASSTTFGRNRSQDYAFNAGLRYRFTSW